MQVFTKICHNARHDSVNELQNKQFQTFLCWQHDFVRLRSHVPAALQLLAPLSFSRTTNILKKNGCTNNIL